MLGASSPASHASRAWGLTAAFCAATSTVRRALSRAHLSSAGLAFDLWGRSTGIPKITVQHGPNIRDRTAPTWGNAGLRADRRRGGDPEQFGPERVAALRGEARAAAPAAPWR